MDLKKIFQPLQAKQYSAVYLIDGEETYYIDKITDYFENKVLSPHERDFNLTVLYGKEVIWTDVISACRRFPMFADKQVVILKDAAQLKDLKELAPYILQPAPTTIFVIEHKYSKADSRTLLVKNILKKGVYITSDKVKDEHLPDWIQEFGREINFKIGEQESQLIATNLGNDLQKIVNEIEKVRINVPEEKELSIELIRKFIGISREYNVFEFPKALTAGDLDKFYRMLAYFVANPKSAPLVLVIGSFYNHFNQLYKANFVKGLPAKDAAVAIGIAPYFVKDLLSAVQQWHLQRVEQTMLLLSKYSARSVGIKTSTTDDSEMLKEMVGKMLEI